MSSKKLNRRELIGAMGAAAGAAVAFGCGSSPTSPSSTATTPTTTTGTNAACQVTPTETVGPYPSLTDLFRSDVREGKSGTQLMLTIKVVNATSSCAPVSGANVDIWHVDAAGNYPQCRRRDFADSLSSELVTPTGDPSGGYAASFQVGIAA